MSAQLEVTLDAAEATTHPTLEDFPPMEVTPPFPLPPAQPSKRPSDQGAPQVTTENSTSPANKRACSSDTNKPFQRSDQRSSPPAAAPPRAATAAPQGFTATASSSTYKVAIKPRERFNILSLPTKLLQQTLDSCLETSGFTGCAYHSHTNTISVWVPSLEAVQRLCSLHRIPLAAEKQLPVQVYLLSGSDIRRYVVSGVDPGEDPEVLRASLRCATHQVLFARYMGSGRTCLVTLRGPLEPPERLLYNG